MVTRNTISFWILRFFAIVILVAILFDILEDFAFDFVIITSAILIIIWSVIIERRMN